MPSPQQNKLTLCALSLASPITGLGVDLYSPSLPAMAIFFHVSPSAIKMTIAIYLMGVCFGQVIFGTMSDIVGRRKMIWILSVAYCIVSFGISMVYGIGPVLLLRLLQGLATGGIASVARSQVTDIYHGGSMRKISSYMTIAWGLGPVLAPWIGGMLEQYFSWQYCFYFYTLYGLIFLSLNGIGIKESLQVKQTFSRKKLFDNYKTIFKEKHFIISLLLLALSYFTLTIFGIVGPFLIQKTWGYQPIVYGHMALLAGAGYLTGTILYRFLIKRFSDEVLLKTAYSLMVAIVVLATIVSLWILHSLILLLAPIYFVCACIGFIYPALLGRVIFYFPKMAGTASAVMGTSVFLVVSGLSALLSLLHVSTLTNVLLIYFCVSAVGALVFVLYYRTSNKATHGA